MTKNELAHKVADRLGLSKDLTKRVIDHTFECIYMTAEDGEKVNVGPFIFKLHTRAARKGRNPQTGETIDLPESKSIVCRVKMG